VNGALRLSRGIADSAAQSLRLDQFHRRVRVVALVVDPVRQRVVGHVCGRVGVAWTRAHVLRGHENRLAHHERVAQHGVLSSSSGLHRAAHHFHGMLRLLGQVRAHRP